MRATGYHVRAQAYASPTFYLQQAQMRALRTTPRLYSRNSLLRFPCLTEIASALCWRLPVQHLFNCVIPRLPRSRPTTLVYPLRAFIRPALPLRRVGAVFASNRTTTKET